MSYIFIYVGIYLSQPYSLLSSQQSAPENFLEVPEIFQNSSCMLMISLASSEVYLNIVTYKALRLLVRSSFVFCKQQLLFAKINHVIYFSQSHLRLTKTNED